MTCQNSIISAKVSWTLSTTFCQIDSDRVGGAKPKGWYFEKAHTRLIASCTECAKLPCGVGQKTLRVRDLNMLILI